MGDVAALEAQIAFVEDAVQTLDDALAAQQQHILRLERQIDRLQQQLKELHSIVERVVTRELKDIPGLKPAMSNVAPPKETKAPPPVFPAQAKPKSRQKSKS